MWTIAGTLGALSVAAYLWYRRRRRWNDDDYVEMNDARRRSLIAAFNEQRERMGGFPS